MPGAVIFPKLICGLLLAFCVAKTGLAHATGAVTPQHETVQPEAKAIDFASLIALKTGGEAFRLRQRLRSHVFNRSTLPRQKLRRLGEVSAEAVLGKTVEARAERLVYKMRFGFRHTVFRFTPPKPNGQVFIYAQGHDGPVAKGADTIILLLANGMTVYAMPMICLGESVCPAVVNHPRVGPIGIVLPGGWNHEPLRLLKQDGFNPISLFIEPMVATVNTIRMETPSAGIAVTGLSGGGWMATLLPAIDPRVRWSFPVAGTIPHPLWFVKPALGIIGDYEQSDPELYNIANYLELYVLAGLGKGRKSIQILNQYDSCCAAGLNARTYEAPVRDRILALGGGSFQPLIEPGPHGHAVSPQAIELMVTTVMQTTKR